MTDTDVLIVGAGPVGLLIANFLGARGLRVVLVEREPQLIDYPRGVGMDDESLRALQAAGLIEQVLPHISPDHWMYFLTSSGRRFLSIEPRTDEFGWARRNAFIQPLIDGVLANGLARFPHVSLRFGIACEGLLQDRDGVLVTLSNGGRCRARYVIGCDGGRSLVRKTLGIAFKGRTHRNRWLVVDIANDPIGTPGVHFHCVRPRPSVSIALPHAIRRLEFMLGKDEAPGDVVPPDLLDEMLRTRLENLDHVELIRARVYAHNGRLAARFRRGRVLIAGDAAHVMPVWQGQGYNSGIRDAFNLSWKLALVLSGTAGDALLDSYEAERQPHARAMISLSEMAGKILSPTGRLAVALRDMTTYVLGAIPPVKRYFMEMRFKPMPRYSHGALVYGWRGYFPASPVGRMFPQPRVELPGEAPKRLDDVIGAGFGLIAWGTNPAHRLSHAGRQVIDRLEAKLLSVVPLTQLAYERDRHPGVVVVGDSHGRLKDWFDAQEESVVLLRPDRIVALACRPDMLDAQVRALAEALHLSPATANGAQDK